MKRAVMALLVLSSLVVAACFSEHVTAADGPDIDRLCGANPGNAVVQIRNYAFHPAQLTVAPGTTVTFANCDQDIHTSTADSNAWDSGLLSPRTSYSRAMSTSGSFAYHCEPHPFMTGTVQVE